MRRVQKHELAHVAPQLDEQFHDEHDGFKYKTEGIMRFVLRLVHSLSH